MDEPTPQTVHRACQSHSEPNAAGFDVLNSRSVAADDQFAADSVWPELHYVAN